VVYSIAPVSGASSYTWTLSSGITGSSTGTSITVNFSGSFNGGTISVKANSACGSSANTSLSIIKFTAAPATPGTISEPGTLCPPATATYTIAGVTNATNYNWTVSGTGLSIVSGQGTTSLNVSVASGFTGGSISVVATNCKGTSSTRSSTIYGPLVNAPVFSVITSGDDNPTYGVCAGTTREFDLNPIPGATTITWTAPAGAVVSDGCGHTGNPLTTSFSSPSCSPGSAITHPEIRITFPSGFVSGNITAYATNACGNSPVATWYVQSKPNAPAAISGSTSGLCNQSGKIYTIAAVPGATSYTWTVPPGASITANSGTSITVSFGSSFTGSGTITVKANNTCGSSAVTSLAVSALALAPASITGSTSVCKTQTSVPYSIAAVTGATSYTWTITGGATFVTSSTSTSVNVKFTTATSTSATLSVKANNACGSSAITSLVITIKNTCRTRGISDDEEETLNPVSVYPNPTHGKLNISFVADKSEKYVFRIADILGHVLLTESVSVPAGNNQKEFDLTNVSKGIYFLQVEQECKQNSVYRIIVE